VSRRLCHMTEYPPVGHTAMRYSPCIERPACVHANRLPALTLEPELSSNIHHSQTRERCPDIRFVEHSTDGRRLLGGIRTDVEKPRLDLPDGAIRHIDASYALSLVIDEPA